MTDGDPGRVRPLLDAAVSPSFQVRAAAGRELAQFAGSPSIDQVLLRLLLDQTNTAVTYDTAQALLRRGDRRALRLVAAALATSDEDTGNWLNDAIDDTCLQSWDDLAKTTRQWQELTHDPDPHVRAGAHGLLNRIHTHPDPTRPDA